MLYKSIPAIALLFLLMFESCNTSKSTANTTNTKDSSSSSSSLNISALSSNTTSEDSDEGKSGMEASLPFDPNVRTGTLENGMVYYIRKNAKPENRIELRLAVNAGSMQEEDDQQGLAHFVEHMAFNGTKHFEKNELVNFLESTGVRFGADLNAYTSFDETVYMLQLPTDKEGLVDKGLLVMSDWATGVTFDGEEIDKERGVIQSEWRTRLGASERMRHAWWPKVFYKTRYADRLPIGKMDVIKNAPYERFTTFYKDWYRPNLQAIIVVGDLEVDDMEKRIKETFSGNENPETAKEKIEFKVPDHNETFISIATDKEATGSNVSLYTKHAPFKIKTLDNYRTYLMHRLFNSMYNERFQELAQEKEAPFIYAGAGYGSFVRSKDVFSVSASAKEGRIEDCMEVLMRENKRLLLHGFTGSELDRQKLNLMSQYENQFNEKDKITSARISMQCVQHFLDDNPMFGPEKNYNLAKEFLPSISLKEINELARQWIIETNRSVVITGPASQNMPEEDAIRSIINKAAEMQPEAYKDKFTDMPLIQNMPKKGAVAKREPFGDKSMESTLLTLSNGVKVILKKTSFQNDQILLSAYSPGGTSMYDDEDFFSADMSNLLVLESGVGEFDKIALDRKLTGKRVQVGPYVAELYDGFSGSSSVEDVETMLKLIHLYGTSPRKDKDAFDKMISSMQENVKNAMSNPMMYFQNEIGQVKNNKSIRKKMMPSLEDIEKVDFDRTYDIYKERFSNFNDYTFVFVGNFEEEKLIPMIETYLGSLPSTGVSEKWVDRNIGHAENAAVSLKKGLAPQANVYMGFVKEMEYSDKNSMMFTFMSRVLSIMVRENLREDKGGVYSPYVGGRMVMEPEVLSDLTVFFQCAPDRVEELMDAVKEEIKALQQNGPSQKNFDKVKETLRRSRESDLEKNRFWLGRLGNMSKFSHMKMGDSKYYELLDSMTLEEIHEMAKKCIDLENMLSITLKPEVKTDERP